MDAALAEATSLSAEGGRREGRLLEVGGDMFWRDGMEKRGKKQEKVHALASIGLVELFTNESLLI